MRDGMENATKEWEAGMTAPADGNAGAGDAADLVRAGLASAGKALTPEGVSYSAADLGPNFEGLEEERPELVNALRELVRQYRQEGVTARRHEIRRIRQARLFWQGLQYAWWNPNDMNWHLPFEQKFNDDRALEEMPRYQFVTNFYQGFGLSFVAVLSQDVPSVRFYPQSFQSLVDIAAARAASDVADLIERNNHVEHLLTSIGYFLWTDGKLGAYVRYVEDAQRFGFREEELLEAVEIPLGEDSWVCPECGKETPAEGDPSWLGASQRPATSDQEAGQEAENEEGFIPQNARDGEEVLAPPTPLGMTNSGEDDEEGGATSLGAARKRAQAGVPVPQEIFVCPGCGAEMGEKDLRMAERVTVPRVAGVRRVANGQ